MRTSPWPICLRQKNIGRLLSYEENAKLLESISLHFIRLSLANEIRLVNYHVNGLFNKLKMNFLGHFFLRAFKEH